jgi:RNA polymerase sigma-70 factor (ECF subfamily)
MTQAALFEREAIPQLQALQRFAYQLCQNAEDSRDLVQETMLKAYTHFHAYEAGTNCRAWLFQICKNSYINNYRRKQLEPFTVDFQDESNDGSGSADDHGSLYRLLRDDSDITAHGYCLSDDVFSALQQLSEEQQTSVLLSDVEGHTYQEIAEFMQVPVGTIRSRIHRGRRLLARLLSDRKTRSSR